MYQTKWKNLKNCNNDYCSKCAGACCKSMGCEISPNDLDNISVETLVDLFNSGVVSVDCWEEPHGRRTYYLRIRNTNTGIVEFSWKGTCVLLGDEGCQLEYKYRGKGGRELVPGINKKCTAKYTKEQCKKDWSKYQDIIEEALASFPDKSLTKNDITSTFAKMLNAFFS